MASHGIYVVVGHRAIISFRFWKPQCVREVLLRFLIDIQSFRLGLSIESVSHLAVFSLTINQPITLSIMAY